MQPAGALKDGCKRSICSVDKNHDAYVKDQDHHDIHEWQESRILYDAYMVRIKTVTTFTYSNHQRTLCHPHEKYIKNIMCMLIWNKNPSFIIMFDYFSFILLSIV